MFAMPQPVLEKSEIPPNHSPSNSVFNPDPWNHGQV